MSQSASFVPGTAHVQDFLYTLCRHRWKIVFCAILGLAGAAALYLTALPRYESGAKLLVRYVMDSPTMHSFGGESMVRSPDSRGDNIIQSEIEILTSQDLALAVADSIGPARIVKPHSDRTNRVAAANELLRNLTVEVPRRSNVILVSLQHHDPEIAQLALRQLIDGYLAHHAAVHRGNGSYDFLRREADLLRERLHQTESELQRLKREARVISLEESKVALSARMARIRELILEEETQVAGHRARLSELENWIAPARASAAGTNGGGPMEMASPDLLDRYQMATARLASLQQHEFNLLGAYTADHPQVRLTRRQIGEAIAERRKLEAGHPGLNGMLPGLMQPGVPREPEADPLAARSLIAAADARIASLNAQWIATQSEAAELDRQEQAIVDLQRRKELEEARFRYFSEQLERWRYDSQLDPKSAPNISKIQEPNTPIRAMGDLYKHMGLVALLGLVLGVGMALLIDGVLDPSIKRPAEVESRLRIPLMLSIPHVARRRKSLVARWFRFFLRRPSRHDPWELSAFIRPFCEAMRDRLILSFELKHMTHRPKLVAVTGCDHGAGTTTLATGLAAALSEPGDGKVLLVNMDTAYDGGHSFYQGQLTVPLTDAIDPAVSGLPGMTEHLYLATASGSPRRTGPMIPKEFYALLPRLKSSDFDYIVFDMPPVNQTSATMALAAFMDQVLLVIEAEKTNRDLLKRTYTVLTGAQATVAGIFNKHRDHAPGWGGER
jgi:polysaccharide biosynthesis transport protein